MRFWGYSANLSSRSVVGSFVPKRDPVVGMNEQAPTNIEEDNRVDYGFDQFNEFDGAFYNNDPIVDLNEDGDAELEVHEPIEVPSLRLELPPPSPPRPRSKGKTKKEEPLGVKITKHCAPLDSRHADNRQATEWVVGHLIKNKFKSDGTKYKAKDIQRDMFREYGIKMSYEKAWRCREKGLLYSRGTPAAAYSRLLLLLRAGTKNPGTITDIITEDNRFKSCFGPLFACRRGFKFCRPVISIDGTFLKTRFGGTMLVAVAYDANNQLFPIAFAIVDSENHDSWKYFLQKLKEAIGEVENLVFVSDRHQSIEHAVEVIFPEACHCACYKHISMNVTHKFKTDVCNTQIWLAAYAWSKRECDRHLQVLRQMDPPIAAYVDNIGLEKWARPYCLGDRYNIMTNNAAESLNNASKCVTPLATHFEEDLIKQHEDGRRRSALRNGAQLFNVGRGADGSDFEKGGDVNLVERTCTCGMFQLLKIPCPHACAAALTQNVSVYALSSPYYTKETWKIVVNKVAKCREDCR
ncbi:uncharacterized protein LOC115704630 [Cannabis sativa]|uniref:uncharacterized protein LOC115704630 n=1 Tax=Cannabis sativa TaxID=3483 RepID=UPI0029CA043A|nr:uncharacterized protein LOC115704630 [Cannabis sativa]